MSQESRHSLAWSPGSGSLTRLQSRCQPWLRLCQGSTERTHSQAHSCGCWQDLVSHRLDRGTGWLLDEGHRWSQLRGCLHRAAHIPATEFYQSYKHESKRGQALSSLFPGVLPVLADRWPADLFGSLFIPFSCNSLAVVKFQPDSRRSRNAFFL